MSDDDDLQSADEPQPPGPYWGPLPTLLLSFGIFVAFIFTWEIGTSFVTEAGYHRDDAVGLHFMAGYTAGTIGGIAFIVMLIRSRRTVTVAEYLAWRRPAIGTTLLGLLGMAAVVGVVQLIGTMNGLAVVESAVQKNLATSEFPLMYVLVTATVVPLFDAVYFHGFILRGMTESRLGEHGGAAVTTLIWTLMQIPWSGATPDFDVAALQTVQLVAMGAILAYTRLRSNSLIASLIVGSALNLTVLYLAHLLPTQ